MNSQSPQEAFYAILSKCLDKDNVIRKAAEEQITSISLTNYDDILINCSAFLMNDNFQNDIRQLCAVIIKNSVAGEDNIKRWLTIPDDKKNEIKSNVLACLGSEKKEIRRGAATAVAAIAKIELQRGTWTTLIPTLYSASQHQNINYKLSSIITAGYICQEVERFSNEDRDQVSKMIFTYLPYGTVSDKELIKQNLNALSKFLIFLEPNMKDKAFREELFKQLFNYILHIPSDEIDIAALQCVNDVAKMYYDYIPEEMPLITQFISDIMKSPNEKIATQGYMFWISLSEEEINRVSSNKKINSYCQQQFKVIWEDVKLNLEKRNPEFERNNEDNFTRYLATSYLLDNFSKLLDVSFINDIFNFITVCLSTKNEEKQTIAFYTFASVLETKWKNEIEGVLPECIKQLVPLLHSQYPDLQMIVAWCFDKIAEFHSVVFRDPALFKYAIDEILNTIKSFPQKVTVHLVYTIHHLAYNLRPLHMNEPYIFSPYLSTLLNLLINLAYSKNSYNPDHNVSVSCFLTIGTLIEGSYVNDRQVIQDFFAVIYDALEKSLKKENFLNENMMYDFQGYISNVIVAYSSSRNFQMTIEQAKLVYSLFSQSFKQRGELYEDGILACASLSNLVSSGYEVILDDFMKYLIFALNKYQETIICSKAIFAISDLISSMGDAFFPYLEKVLPQIMNIINYPDADKILKVQVLLVFCDIYGTYSNGEQIWKYYNNIMDYITKAMEASYSLVDENDPDLSEYYHLLRERIIECLSCIIRTIADTKKGELFSAYLEQAMEFITFTNSPQITPNVGTINDSAGFICDLIDIYGKKMAEHLNDDCIKYMTKELKNSNIPEYSQLADHLQQKALMVKIDLPPF